MVVTIRPATSADILAMFGQSLPYRVKAYAAEYDGDLIGVGGLTFQPEDTVAAFMLLKPEARRFKMTLHKMGLRVIREAREAGFTRLVTFADAGIPTAVPWLRRLGFEPVDTGDGKTAWVFAAQKE